MSDATVLQDSSIFTIISRSIQIAKARWGKCTEPTLVNRAWTAARNLRKDLAGGATTLRVMGEGGGPRPSRKAGDRGGKPRGATLADRGTSNRLYPQPSGGTAWSRRRTSGAAGSPRRGGERR